MSDGDGTRPQVRSQAYAVAVEWRLKYIKERRAERLRKAKARELKGEMRTQRLSGALGGQKKSAVGDLKSKALLLGESDPVDSDTSQSSEEEQQRRKTPVYGHSESEGSGSDDGMEQYWSAEHGLRMQPKNAARRAKAKEKRESAAAHEKHESEWRDKYVLYPILGVTAVGTMVMLALLLYVFISDGTAQRMLELALRFLLACILSFLVLVQFTFLYEHLTQAPSFNVRSPGFVVTYVFFLVILTAYPALGAWSIAGGVLATFIYQLLGLSSEPGTIFPLVFFPLCSCICYAMWPMVLKLGNLLATEMEVFI